jgi:hypothetical protein
MGGFWDWCVQNGTFLGGCFLGAVIWARINMLSTEIRLLKDSELRFMKEDIRDYTRERYQYITRSELAMREADLRERIAVLEAVIRERKSP